MFPTLQVGNFTLQPPGRLWEMSDVEATDELEGARLYDALMALKPAHLAETDWAQQAGVNRGWFGNLKSKSRNPRRDTLSKVLAHIGKTEADLRPAAPAPQAGGRLPPEKPPTRSVDAGETVEIVRLDLSLPMGPGATVDDYIEEESIVFDLGYIRSFTRTPPARLRLARGVGDSMFPTLNSNDLVWIDSTQTSLNQQDRVWAVSINGAAAIKRLRRVKGGRVLIVSDNPTIENYEVDEHDELLIGGRVIRFARDL